MSEVGCLLLLVWLDLPSVDWSRPAEWLVNVRPEDAVIALVRATALVIAGYLLASTALYALATLTRLPRLIRGTRVLTLPSVRRVVDGALAAAIVASPASPAFGAAPASAHTAPASGHAYAPVPAGDSGTAYTPTPAGGSTAPPRAAVYVVRSGDSLWTIAAKHLATVRAVGVAQVTDAEICKFWRTLVELNASSLASGDPDVIFPGEPLRLPSSSPQAPDPTDSEPPLRPSK